MTIHRVSGHHGFGKIGEIMGTCVGLCPDIRGLSYGLYYGRLQMGSVHPRNGGTVQSRLHRGEQRRCSLSGVSKVDGCIIPDEAEVMQMLDELPTHIKLIAVHMDAIDHCQTTREILRNEAWHHGADMNRLIIPEDGETIKL